MTYFFIKDNKKVFDFFIYSVPTIPRINLANPLNNKEIERIKIKIKKPRPGEIRTITDNPMVKNPTIIINALYHV